MHSENSVNEVKLNKDGTPSMRGKWKRTADSSEKPKRKKTGGRVKGSPYKKKGKAAKKDPKTFLFFTIGKDEFTELIPEKEAEDRAMQIFSDPDYKDLKHIYFMKPLKLYSRPTLIVTQL